MRTPLFAMLLLLWTGHALAQDCSALLADADLPETADNARFSELVSCRAAVLAGQVQGEADPCTAAFEIAARLDLSSFRSSLGPRLNGPTRMADMGPVTIDNACARIDFGEPDWTRALTIIALSPEAAIVHLTDKAMDAEYDRPSALRIRSTFEGAMQAESFCAVARKSDELDKTGCP